MTGEVKNLARRALRIWADAATASPEVVVQPAIPILYFGDLNAYLSSPKKIITVGLNPSRAEFPTATPFSRFPGSENRAADDVAAYLASLNEYFQRDPYRDWFGSLEPILQGAGASFYPGAESTSLHTDLCSPVATNPTWSRLPLEHRERLILSGRPIWHDLVRHLQPHVLLISVAREHLGAVEFERDGDAREIYRLERERPYIVSGVPVRVHKDSTSLLVFGRAAQRPFGTIDSEAKLLVGQRIAEELIG